MLRCNYKYTRLYQDVTVCSLGWTRHAIANCNKIENSGLLPATSPILYPRASLWKASQKSITGLEHPLRQVFHIPPFMPKSIVVPMGNNTVYNNIRNGWSGVLRAGLLSCCFPLCREGNNFSNFGTYLVKPITAWGLALSALHKPPNYRAKTVSAFKPGIAWEIW